MGIQLPDLEFKVKADDKAFEVTAAKAKLLGDGVERSLGPSSPAGRALVTFGEGGELASLKITSSSAKTRGELDQLIARTKALGETVGKDLGPGVTAMVRLGEDGTASLSRLGQAATAAVPSVANLGTIISSFVSDVAEATTTGPVMAAIIAAIGADAAVAAAPLAAMAAGLAATLAVGGGVLGAFGALGAAAVLLSQRAGGATSAFQRLTDHVGKLADALGKQAAPAANAIYDWLGKVADRIAPVASQLVSWFGERLPKVLPIVTKLMDDVGAQLVGFGAKLGPIVDNWIKHPEAFERTFHDVGTKVIAVTEDVIAKAAQLAAWWADHHVTLERDATLVFDAIGLAARVSILVVGDLVSKFDQMVAVFEAVGRAVSVVGDVIAANFRTIGREAAAAENAVGALALALSRLPGLGGLTSLGADLVGNQGILGSGKRARGGPVMPGGIYTVGERGPETLVMGSHGGYVIPNSGGSARPAPNVTFNIYGAENPDAVAMAVDRRLSRLLLAT